MGERVKVLFIAPLPPPITGHSLVSRVLLDDLVCSHDVNVVDLSVGSANDGSVSRRRIVEVAKVLVEVWRKKRSVDAIYLTISESIAGNIKDLLIYMLCFRMLSRFYIHLHGGTIKKLLFDHHPVLRWLNAVAVRRLAGVIVSGPAHEHIFAQMIDRDRIHIVPNFAPDEMFIAGRQIADKFARAGPLVVLYISGMTEGKGYRDLADAYLLLGDEARQKVRVDFAGRFDTERERDTFLERIAGVPGIVYHGVVGEDRKRSLFADTHVLCLPTTMFEGQPICILEAYAAGCVVVATGQEGVRDIFADGVNGFEIEARSPKSITSVIGRISEMRAALEPIAMLNRRLAEERYRAEQFNAAVTRILITLETEKRSA